MSRLVPASRSKAGRGGLGRIVGLMDISKPGGSWFLDRVEKLLLSRGEASEVRRYAKPTFAKPCPDKLRKQIASECVWILALADEVRARPVSFMMPGAESSGLPSCACVSSGFTNQAHYQAKI